MSWVIVSRRVGIPGTPFVPGPGINVEALVAGGFIRPSAVNDDPPAAPQRKVTKRPKE